MIDPADILLTGGSGRLGTELRTLLAGVSAPDEKEMDILDPRGIERKLDATRPSTIVHCAAYTDVSGAETHRKACWQVNVEGTRNIVRACWRRDIRLVHISTDYVFEGTAGGYGEDDPVGPPINYYALSKLAAEQCVRLAPRHLVIRTSFRPREWPYPKAFTDVHTSQDYVDVIAPMIAQAIGRCDEIPYNTLHVATERKSVYELARRRRDDVEPASKAGAGVRLPDDVSLDTRRWNELTRQWNQP
jgi:dTDP-4-dehydrorhamnose reductase